MIVENVLNWKIYKSTSYEEDFFNLFSSNSCEEKEKVELSSLKEMMSFNCSFSQNNYWQGIIVTSLENKSNKMEEKFLGRIFISFPKLQAYRKPFAFFGYFIADSTSVGSLLIEQSKKWVSSFGLNEIRGPIEGNIYNCSKIPQSKKYSKNYHDLFLDLGLSISSYAVDLKISKLMLLKQFVELSFKCPRNLSKITIEEIPLKKEGDQKNHDENLVLLYELMVDSFSTFKEFTPYTFEEFLIWSKDLIQLSDQNTTLIALDEFKRPVAFLIGFNNPYDPHQFLIVSIGKRNGYERKIEGVTSLLLKEIYKRKKLLWQKSPLFCFIDDCSKARKFFDHTLFKKINSYCLYKLNFEKVTQKMR